MKIPQFYRNTAFVILINGLTLGCGLFKNLILGRYLTATDLGIYSLLLAISGFVHPLSLIGQQTSLVRFLSSQNVQAFDCVKGVAQILGISLGLIIIGTMMASKIYSLTWLAGLFLLVVTFSTAVTDLVPGVLRAQGIYYLSILFFRGVNFFLVIGLVVLVLIDGIRLENVLWTFILISFGFALVTGAGAKKFFGRGEKAFPASIWRDGFFLLGTHLSLLLIVSFDRLLIPKLISFEMLGLYFAISAVMRLFELAVQSVEFVLLPGIGRLSKDRLLSLSLLIIGAGLILAVGHLIAGPYIVSLVYQGKYDSGTFLIPYFCVIGFMSFVYVIPYTLISGRMSSRCIRWLLYGNIVAMLTNIALAFVFISRWGLLGAVWTSIVVWLMRLLIAGAIIFFENPSSLEHLHFTNMKRLLRLPGAKSF